MTEDKAEALRKEVADKLREEEEVEKRLEAEVLKRLSKKQGIAESFVDPGPMNGFRKRPANKDGTKLGRELYERMAKRLK